jgi:hypothetical protein
MQNISFSATIPQFRARQKHVTRRGNAKGPAWKNLVPGNQLMGCEKCQGLGKGGKIVKMGPITILEVSREPLSDIIRIPLRINKNTMACYPKSPFFLSEVAMEGFPDLTEQQFVEKFCDMNNCEPETEITRILFDYVGAAL